MKATRRTRRAARQLYRLCLVDGALDAKRARLVADWLVTSRRRGALPALSGFLRLVRLDRDRRTARVESAAPLAEPARERIRSGLARTYGASLEASFAENPALIGGVRVRVGSDVFDGTIRARLAALQARL
jgi:F-type H+-transporting ATPase subunit delta